MPPVNPRMPASSRSRFSVSGREAGCGFARAACLAALLALGSQGPDLAAQPDWILIPDEVVLEHAHPAELRAVESAQRLAPSGSGGGFRLRRIEGSRFTRVRSDGPVRNWRPAQAELRKARRWAVARDPESLASKEGSLRFVSPDLAVRARSEELARGIAATHGLVYSRPAPVAGWHLLEAADGFTALEALGRLRAAGQVCAPIAARQATRRLIPDDPLFPDQWHLLNAGQGGGVAGIDASITGVWDAFTGQGVSIAIIDDGVQIGHEDLAPNARPLLDGSGQPNHYDFNFEDNDPTPSNLDSHGTECAGVAAARGNNGLGVSGAAPRASIVGLRLIAAPSSDLEEAEAFGWRRGDVQIYSNSWGPTDSGAVLGAAGSLAAASLAQGVASGRGGLGSIYIWAAGNGRQQGDNLNYDGFANAPESFAIGAVTNLGAAAGYSERGASLLTSTPSNGGTRSITTTQPGASGGSAYTNFFGGTSSAAPLAAGIAALALEARPDLGWRDLKEIFIRASTADALQPAEPFEENAAGLRHSNSFGFGRLRADAAVSLAQSWSRLGPEETVALAPIATRSPITDGSPEGAAALFQTSTDFRVEQVEIRVSTNHGSRGDLLWELRSPSGMVSRIEPRPLDTGSGLSNWRFTTLRHWGEPARGTWKLEAIDLEGNSASGSLTSAQLILRGTSAPLAPRIDSLLPEGANLRILGANLAQAQSVRIGGTQAAILTVAPDSILCTPASDTPRMPVVVRTQALAAVSATLPVTATPVNDRFAQATRLDTHFTRWLASASGGTREPGEPGSAGTATVWFRWTANRTASHSVIAVPSSPAGGLVAASTSFTVDVFSGSTLETLAPVPLTPSVQGAATWSTFPAISGVTYQVRVTHATGSSPAADVLALALRPTPGAAPVNDAFAGALTLTGLSGTTTGTNVNATVQPSEPSPASASGSRSVWWQWTAPTSGSTTIHTIGSDFDTTLGVYTGSSVTALSQVGANDDIDTLAGNLASRVTFQASAGTTYRIQVNSWSSAIGVGGTPGNIVLSWSGNPPSITSVSPAAAPPLSTVTVSGTHLQFVTGASLGGIPATFVPGANGSLSLTVPAGAQDGPILLSYSVDGTLGTLPGVPFDVTLFTYDFWASLHFTPEQIASGLSIRSVDADADSLPNLVEYALGSDPRLAEPFSLPIPAFDIPGAPGVLSLRVRRSMIASEVVLQARTGGAPDALNDLAEQVPGSTPVQPGIEEILFRDTQAPAPGAPRFIQLEAVPAL